MQITGSCGIGGNLAVGIKSDLLCPGRKHIQCGLGFLLGPRRQVGERKGDRIALPDRDLKVVMQQ